jgi:uncharacterized protein (TIGR03118 family)
MMSVAALTAATLTTLALSTPAEATPTTNTFNTINLITDNPLFNSAPFTDPTMVNPWGMSYLPGGPLWVSANNGGVAEIYTVQPHTAVTRLGGITIPGDGTPTGQAANTTFSTGSFNGDLFVFVSEDGTISGWRFALGGMAETLQTASTANVYKGASIEIVGGHSYLLAANFRNGTIDVLKGDAAAPSLAGNFTDPTIPAGYAPFNVQELGGHVFVTYALQDAAKHDDVKGPGHGFIDEFTTDGVLITRIASGGDLNSPWGLSLAPSKFGQLDSDDLIVGNFGDGTLHVFDISDGSEDGAIDLPNGKPLTILGLWGIIPGNGGLAGTADELIFSSGPQAESHGLLGLIVTPEPGTIAFLLAGLAGLGFAFRRRTPGLNMGK